jgi:hypothetical protein
MEIWKPVVGYEGLYEVSSLGRVKSLQKTIFREKHGNWVQPERILKNSSQQNGYVAITIYKNGKAKRINIHRLVCVSFVQNPNNKPCVNHKNGVKSDNRLENLEWVTFSENTFHAFNKGFLKPLKGESNGSSKLLEKQVYEIREKLSKKHSVKSLMEEYSISRSHIQRIRNKKCWINSIK